MENLTGGTPPVRYLPCVVPCKLYFGVIKEKSKGVLPCVIAHMLIDSFAVLMLVQSNLIPIIILVSIEIICSWFADKKLVV